jgi:hypothetical protein
MPLGNVIGEFTGKIMSVRQTDLGGGQLRVELDAAGETSGQAQGQFFSTMVIEGVPGQAVTYTSTGTLLAASGAVVRVTGRGVGIRTGQGHKGRYRGAGCASTADLQLAALNSLLTAAEFEIDPATLTVQGAVCEWK